MARIPSSLSRISWRMHVVDLLIAAAAPLFAMAAREPTFWYRDDLLPLLQYAAVSVVAAMICLQQFGVAKILARFLSTDDVGRIIKASAAAAALSAAISFMLMRLDGVPRSLPVLHFLMLAAGFVGARWFRSEHFRRLDQPDQDAAENVLVIGATQLAALFLRMQAFMPGPRQRVVAMLDDNVRMSGRSFGGVPVLGAVGRCDAVLREYATHGVFIRRILVAHHDPRLREAAERVLADCCAERGIRLEFLADRFLVSDDIDAEEARGDLIDAAALPDSFYVSARRVLERAAACVALVVISPLLAFVALCVLVDVGAPLVFWQERVGRFGKSIFVHKFRTLCASVDRNGVSIPEDKRLSRIGALLRATRLDELPQLYDIARGAMSLIGPRPLLPVDMPQDSYLRQQVAPGITGWAQVNGGKLINAEEKNALDEWYIAHMSLAVDLQIVWRTIVTAVGGDRRNEAAVREALAFRAQRSEAGSRTAAPLRTLADGATEPLIFRHHSA